MINELILFNPCTSLVLMLIILKDKIKLALFSYFRKKLIQKVQNFTMKVNFIQKLFLLLLITNFKRFRRVASDINFILYPPPPLPPYSFSLSLLVFHNKF